MLRSKYERKLDICLFGPVLPYSVAFPQLYPFTWTFRSFILFTTELNSIVYILSIYHLIDI